MRTFIDPQGNKVHLHEQQSRPNSTTPYSVEVVNPQGEVIDHFTLYGDQAVDYCARARNWTKSSTH